MIKGPRFQIVKQFFPNGSIWLLGRRSWALLWAAVQACHMVRLGQAGHALRALQLLPQAPKDNCSAQGKGALRDWVYLGSEGVGLEKAGSSRALPDCFICMHLYLGPDPPGPTGFRGLDREGLRCAGHLSS